MDKQKFLKKIDNERFMEDYAPKMKVRYLIFSALFAFMAMIINKNFYVIIIFFVLMIISLFLALHYDSLMKNYRNKPISLAYFLICLGIETEALFWLFFLKNTKSHSQAKRLFDLYPYDKNFDKELFRKAIKFYKSDDYRITAFDKQILEKTEKICQEKDSDTVKLKEIKQLIADKWQYIKKH